MQPPEGYFGQSLSSRVELMRLERLVQEIRSGRLRVPGFSSTSRWRPEDELRLLDSVLRGYPIGSFLIWQRPGLGEDWSQIGPQRLPVQARPDAWFVLDGQQRLTALAGALIADERQDSRHGVLLDVRLGELRRASSRGFEAGDAVALSTLVDPPRLLSWARDAGLDDVTLHYLFELGQRLRNYEIPVHVLSTQDEALVRDIYLRLNTTGAPLAADDVFRALHTLHPPPSGELDLDALRARVASVDFGTLGDTELLKIAFYVGGLPTSRRPPPLRSDELPPHADVETALLRAIDFLQTIVEIPHHRLLPTTAVLAILARFFHVHPNPEPTNLEALGRWFWREVELNTKGRRSASSAYNANLRIVPDTTRTLRDMLTGPPIPDDLRPAWRLQRFDARSVRGRIELLTLLAQRPLNLPPQRASADEVRGTPVTLSSLLQEERLAAPLLGATQVQGLSREERRLAATAANRALLSRRGGAAAQLQQLDPERHARVLRSHLVSSEALEALKVGEDGRFLRLRAADVATAVDDFLRRRTRWEIGYLAPLSSYLQLPEVSADASR